MLLQLHGGALLTHPSCHLEDDSNSMRKMLAYNQTSWQPKSTRLHRSAEPLVTFLGLFALFAAMTAILFWRWMPHFNSALIGPPEDNMQDFWNTWYARVRGFFCYQYDKVFGGGPFIIIRLRIRKSLP